MSKLFLEKSGEVIDISEYKIVIWGAGQGCIDMMNDLDVGNIVCVVDGNDKLCGSKIMLKNIVYEVRNINELEYLEENKVIIVISSVRYYEDILNSISHIYGNKFLTCIYTELKHVYESVEDLINLDRFMNEKITSLNLSDRRYELIKNANSLIAYCFKEIVIDRYIPIKEGNSKLLFSFGNSKSMYIYSTPGVHSTRDGLIMQKAKCESISKRQAFLNKNDLDSEITVYRNLEGITIQQKGEVVCNLWNKDVLYSIVNECRRIHGITYNWEELEKTSFVEGYYYSYRRLACIDSEDEEKTIAEIDMMAEKAIDILSDSDEWRVIHGDLTYENIIRFNNSVSFIDWEFLSIGNPMIDLGILIHSICKKGYKKNGDLGVVFTNCYSQVDHLLGIYCIDYDERKRYIDPLYAVLDICFIRDVLSEYLMNRKNGINRWQEYTNPHNKAREKDCIK